MPLETITGVDLSPDLENRIALNQDALICVSGLAYMTAIMLEADKLPEFKQSLSLQLYQFFYSANELVEADFRTSEEKELVFATSRLWGELGHETWTNLGVLGWNSRHTKVNIKKTSSEQHKYRLNISPFGKSRAV